MKLCYQKQFEGLAAIAGKLLLTAKPSSASTNQISLPNSNKYLKKINKYWHLVQTISRNKNIFDEEPTVF